MVSAFRPDKLSIEFRSVQCRSAPGWLQPQLSRSMEHLPCDITELQRRLGKQSVELCGVLPALIVHFVVQVKHVKFQNSVPVIQNYILQYVYYILLYKRQERLSESQPRFGLANFLPFIFSGFVLP